MECMIIFTYKNPAALNIYLMDVRNEESLSMINPPVMCFSFQDTSHGFSGVSLAPYLCDHQTNLRSGVNDGSFSRTWVVESGSTSSRLVEPEKG